MNFFAANSDYIFFIHGLSFVLLGVVCSLLKGSRENSLPWGCLGLFGFIHGVSVWLEMVALSLGLGNSSKFQIARVLMMGCSFLPLFEFSRCGWRGNGGKYLGWIFPLLWVLSGSGYFAGADGLGVTVQYGLSFPASLLAACVLWRAARSFNGKYGSGLWLAALALFIYSMVAGWIVSKAAFFPASVINTDSFFRITGFPVSLARSLCSLAIMTGIWRYYRQTSRSPERSKRLPGWLIVSVFFIVLLAGWFVTDCRARATDLQLREQALRDSTSIASTLNPHGVKQLLFTESDKQNPAYESIRKQMIAYGKLVWARGIYSMAVRGGAIVFGPENYPKNNKMASSPGAVYQKPNLENWDLFRTGRPIVKGPVTDEYGTFVSALAPVLDPVNGEVLMVVGLDISADDWRFQIALQRLIAILCTLMLAGLIYVCAHALYRGSQHRKLRYREVLITAFCGFMITVCIVFIVHSGEIEGRRQAFGRLAEAKSEMLRFHLGLVRTALESVAGYFQSNETVSRTEFRSLVKPLARTGWVRSWEWIPRVRAEEKEALEVEARKDGLESFHIYEENEQEMKAPVPERETYYPVYYIEPLAGNEAALGLDLASEKKKRAALEEAARTGFQTASESLELIQGKEKSRGIFIFNPVFSHNAGSQLRGFALAVVSPELVLHKIQREYTASLDDKSAVHMDMYQISSDGGLEWLAHDSGTHEIKHFSNVAALRERLPDLFYLKPFFDFNQTYLITMYPNAEFMETNRANAGWIAGIVGFALTIFFTLFVAFMCMQQARLEMKVQERTAELQELLKIAEKGKEKLKRSQQFLRNVTDNVPGMVCVYRLAPDGTMFFDFVSNGVEKLMELPAEQVQKNFAVVWNLVSPEDVERLKASIFESARVQQPWEYEFKIRTPKGMMKWIHGRSVSLERSEDGNLTWVGALEDITERKQAEEVMKKALTETQQAHDELKLAQKQLVQSEKLAAIGQLAAGIAHEINNPTGFIGSNISTLDNYMADITKIFRVMETLKTAIKEGDLEKAKKIEKEVGELEKETDIAYIFSDVDNLLRESKEGVVRIANIVRDLKVFSHVQEDVFIPSDLCKIIDGVINIVWNEIKYKAELKKNYTAGLSVICNPQQIGQVFINILVNAVQAIKEKGIISVKTYAENGFACIEISDTGCGIPKENLSKIFDPFFTTKEPGKGTGLGLGISAAIMKKHDGQIKVESEPGKGTTFTISLPINTMKGV